MNMRTGGENTEISVFSTEIERLSAQVAILDLDAGMHASNEALIMEALTTVLAQMRTIVRRLASLERERGTP